MTLGAVPDSQQSIYLTVHLNYFLGHQVNINFYFFEINKIIDLIDLLTEIRFEIMDAIERQPYKDVEYQSKRTYIWAKNNNP